MATLSLMVPDASIDSTTDASSTCQRSWDNIFELGWGPEFAAGAVFYFLREERNIERARWYWDRLKEMGEAPPPNPHARAEIMLVRMRHYDVLTLDERKILDGCSPLAGSLDGLKA
jgi:hypothetical protein